MTDKPTNNIRRIDSAGRDVTDLPGLWGEEDTIEAPVLSEIAKAWAEYKAFLMEKYPAKDGDEWQFTCPHHRRIDVILNAQRFQGNYRPSHQHPSSQAARNKDMTDKPTNDSDVWCVYDPEYGLEECATKEEAILAAQRKIKTYRDYQSQEWIDGVEQIAVLKKVCVVRDVSQVPEYQDWRIEPEHN